MRKKMKSLIIYAFMLLTIALLLISFSKNSAIPLDTSSMNQQQSDVSELENRIKSLEEENQKLQDKLDKN